jgi:hypothetical protein
VQLAAITKAINPLWIYPGRMEPVGLIGAPDSLYCCPCLGLDEGVVERTAPHGSAGGFLSGIFSIADLYAFSMAFCFSFSSGVIWRSGDKLIPGIGIWAEAAPVSKAIIAPAWTIFRSMFLVKRPMPQSMPNSASFASRISLLLSVMLFLIPIILCKIKVLLEYELRSLLFT